MEPCCLMKLLVALYLQGLYQVQSLKKRTQSVPGMYWAILCIAT